ncbi:MAG: transcription elongation factor GreA [Sulfurovum sp.]|nr:transcription elongation factor GreA [Sulfurovaceae bacterium]
MEKEPMLEKTYKKLTAELNFLKNEERGNIAKIIDEARALGDLKENAEYHAAKDKQGLMEARINELGYIIGRAQVVDPSKLKHERVSFGSSITITDIKTQKEITYTIVGKQESNPKEGLISIQSPIARLLIGKEEGDEVIVNLPSVKTKYDIEEVFYKEIVI